MDGIEIGRAGGDRDAVAAAALCSSAMPHPWSLSSIRSELALAGASLWLARETPGGGVVGVLLARRVLDVVSVQVLAVAPDRRRQGLAGALLDELLAAGRDAARVELEVRADNVAAIALYTARGFDVVGRRPRYYGGVEDAVLMTLVLPGSK